MPDSNDEQFEPPSPKDNSAARTARSQTKRHKSGALTKGAIKSAVAGSNDLWLSDETPERGGGRLVIRISPSGSKNCYFRYFHAGKARLIPIGPYAESEREGSFTLDQARARARHYAAMHRDPRTSDVRAHVPTLRPQEKKVGDQDVSLFSLCKEYVRDLQSRHKDRSAKDLQGVIDRHLKQHPLAHRPASSITRTEISDLVRELLAKKLTRTARHMKSTLHAAYNLARNVDLDAGTSKELRRFGIVNNPVSGIRFNAKSGRSRRDLNALELGYFWLELTEGVDSHKPANRLVKLGLLLGGQRSVQLRRCKRTGVDFQKNTILLHDPKGRRAEPREHLLPLLGLAEAEVRWWIGISESFKHQYLFPGVNEDSFFSDTACSAAVKTISDKLVAEGRCNSPFTHQSLRHTVESRMSEMNIHEDVCAQVLSHGISGVQLTVYNRWKYFPQKSEALRLWEEYILKWAAIARTGARLSDFNDLEAKMEASGEPD